MAQGPAVLVPKVSLAAMKHEVSAQYQTCSSTCLDLFSKTLVFYYFFFFFFVSCLRSKDIKPRELATKKWLSKQELQADKHKDLKHSRSPSLCLQQYYGKVHKIQTTELNVGLYACLSLKTSSTCSTLSSEMSYSLPEPFPKSSQTLHFVWVFFLSLLRKCSFYARNHYDPPFKYL